MFLELSEESKADRHGRRLESGKLDRLCLSLTLWNEGYWQIEAGIN
jgi:hypothetical protein